jgi:NADPH:quinone reductase-like Zn-dependent oxidoreductase
MTGLPYVVRLAFGVRKPKNGVPGRDVAGIVEAVGKDVTRFQPGDEVFGWCTSGVLAEYAGADQGNLAPKPANLSFEQAAAVTVSATTALQALRDKGEVQPGQKVLIVGASGGVGTFAVQIAKSLGAEVTGVCRTRNVEMVRSISADHVIDYTKEDFTQSGQRYDVILDNAEAHSLERASLAAWVVGDRRANYGSIRTSRSSVCARTCLGFSKGNAGLFGRPDLQFPGRGRPQNVGK